MTKYQYLSPEDTKQWIAEMVQEEITADMLDVDLVGKADDYDTVALGKGVLLDDDAVLEALRDRRRHLQNEAYDQATEEH